MAKKKNVKTKAIKTTVEKAKKSESIKSESEILPEYEVPVVYEPEEVESFVAPVFVQCPNCLKMVDTNMIFVCPQCGKCGCPQCGWDKTKFTNCPNCGIEI